MSRTPLAQFRWSVTVPHRAADGTTGTQTFVVTAHSAGEAVEKAWAKAHEPASVTHRRGAALTAKRHQLHVDRRIPGSHE